MELNTTSNVFNDLVEEYQAHIRDLMDCDPSESENSMDEFFDIQSEGEKLHARIKKEGFTYEQVEEAADALGVE